MANLSDVLGTGHGFLAEEGLTATTSVGITSTIIKPTAANIPAQVALITNGDATIRCRYRLSAAAPTASVGHVLPAGDSFLLFGTQNIRNFRVIGESGSPVVYVTTLA
jgi:hypothetical protein